MDNIVNIFLNLVQLDNVSLDERLVSNYVIAYLKNLDFNVDEDEAGNAVNGTTGNIICKIEGDKKKDSIMFLAHMDSVEPCKNVNPIINGDYIETDKTTVLGGDDLAGVAAMLDLAYEISMGNVSHGDIYLIFTIAEEIGLLGAKNLDLTNIKADYAFVLDSGGPIGCVTIGAPSHITFIGKIKGVASHAGSCPEKGVDAIKIACTAISKLPLGRIDSETTANIGIINGGKAGNIVCDEVIITGECRSRNEAKLSKLSNEIKDILINTCETMGGKIDLDIEKEYEGYFIDENSELLKKFEKACSITNINFHPELGGGGSDTNIIVKKGIKALNISVGMENVHSVEERIKIDNLSKTSKLLKNIVSL